jgi:hypothetical protein
VQINDIAIRSHLATVYSYSKSKFLNYVSVIVEINFIFTDFRHETNNIHKLVPYTFILQYDTEYSHMFRSSRDLYQGIRRKYKGPCKGISINTECDIAI